MAERMSLDDFDKLMEEKKQRVLDDVHAIDRDRATRQSQLDQLTTELADTQQALAKAKRELSEYDQGLSQRKLEWEDSTRRIQQGLETRELSLNDREATIKTGEEALHAAQEQLRMQRLTLADQLDQVASALRAALASATQQTEAALAAFPPLR